ncbi:hypothetical protein [Bifidobacterium italicum]|uniref:hypothetical protein n=1 Tax=Bifidobacterium italicum TaxID=1960968 RepID=UPI00139053F8|nr:hypothetical protein [Bifidobacterium italicum]
MAFMASADSVPMDDWACSTVALTVSSAWADSAVLAANRTAIINDAAFVACFFCDHHDLVSCFFLGDNV